MLCKTGIYSPGGQGEPGYGEDASITAMGDGRYLVQNIDVFTPIVDDPETQGRIAACNVTNDLFACGVLDVTSFLAFLATPCEVPRWALAGILNGMQSFLKDLGAAITKGQTIQNPWLLVGGAASGVVEKEHLVSHEGVMPGDVLVLTKPLGIQSVMAMARVIKHADMVGDVASVMPEGEMRPTIDRVIALMTESNKPVVDAARLLAASGRGRFKVHAMTDVTGFGLAGHAGNLAIASGVDIEITSVPAVRHAIALSRLFGYPMEEGKAAETAGGMLVAVAKADERKFLDALLDKGVTGYVVGRAKAGSGKAYLSDQTEFVDV
ncbi:MAG: selenide, water dikinase SelD [Candidatus Lokiarchaeota archaeon]|nr:selenide, water dikinase SelD [Candidatus Lokiarchaeota archaeon]